jgi:hypothetical protein
VVFALVLVLEDAVREALQSSTLEVTGLGAELDVLVVVVVDVVDVVLESVAAAVGSGLAVGLLVDTAATRWVAPGVCATTATPAPPAARVATASPAAALVETSARSLVGSNMGENLVGVACSVVDPGQRTRELPPPTTRRVTIV